MNVYLPFTARLPSAYQEVEYIQSSGTQRIDTGIAPTDIKFGILGKFRVTTMQTSVLIDLSNTTSTDSKRYGFQIDGSQSKPQWSGIMYQHWHNDNGTINTSTDYEFSYNYNGNASFTINGITKTGIPTGSATLPNRNIFCQNCAGSYQRFFTGRLYWLQLYHNTELLRDFVPCYRKSDNVIGLYDLVNNQFYTNSGTGTFSKGNDVTMSELKNAYIGEYTSEFQYSYDFRNKTTSQFTADGWTAYEGTAYFDADGIYGSSGTLRNKINLQLNLTNAKKITIVENYKWTSSSAGIRTGLAVVSDMTQWNGVYLQGTARGTDLASTFNHVTNSASDATGTYQETLVIDLENKTYTVSGHWSYTVSLTDAQISSIRSTTGLYVMLYTSNYIRVQNVSLTIEY